MSIKIEQRLKMAENVGFTLVELAISMIIIGLIIGGILKGGQMIESAKVKAVITQFKAYEGAVSTFASQYDALPGDISNAVLRIPNCNGANFCVDGNGDELVGGLADPAWNGSVLARPETIQFWKHLSLAHLITGVDTRLNSAVTPTAFGESHPEVKLGGGFEFYFDGTIVAGASGHVFRLSERGVSAGTVGTRRQSAISPLHAVMIDRKIDDGRPLSGSVFSNYGAPIDGSDGCIISAVDYQSTTEKNCVMFFLFEG